MSRFLYIAILIWVPGHIHVQAQEAASSLAGIYSDTSRFQYERLLFNDRVSDFGVTAYRSGYVFTSSRTNQLVVRYFSADSVNPLLDLYYFEKTDSGMFSSPRSFSDELNTARYNEGTPAFGTVGNYMILTSNSKDENGRVAPDLPLALYESNLQSNVWSKPVLLSFCVPGTNYAHPSLAYGDSVLFFSSDLSGGYGGMDIYFSTRKENTWSAPVNAGPSINTPHDELFPFCSPNGNLYFSSDRPGGQGDLDIYVVDISDSAFTRAIALHGPVNSSADDFGFWMSSDESEGFFSSNRNNTADDDDIYYFRLTWPRADSVDTLQRAQLCYAFYEEATLQTGDTALMKYTWTFSDGETKYGYAIEKCFDTTGLYFIRLEVRDSSGGDLVLSEMNYDFEIAEPNYVTLVIPDTVEQHHTFRVSATGAVIQGYSIESVCYDFGDGYRCEGISVSHVYHHKGSHYPRIYFVLRNKETGASENRCVVKKLEVI